MENRTLKHVNQHQHVIVYSFQLRERMHCKPHWHWRRSTPSCSEYINPWIQRWPRVAWTSYVLDRWLYFHVFLSVCIVDKFHDRRISLWDFTSQSQEAFFHRTSLSTLRALDFLRVGPMFVFSCALLSRYVLRKSFMIVGLECEDLQNVPGLIT